MTDHAAWTAQVASELGVDPAIVGELSDPVLDMVRAIAHGVSRPAAPLTAFMVGLASAAAVRDTGGDVSAVVRAHLARVDALVRAHAMQPPS